MLIIKRQRKYQVGGSGIFSKLKDFLSGLIGKKQVVDTALNNRVLSYKLSEIPDF